MSDSNLPEGALRSAFETAVENGSTNVESISGSVWVANLRLEDFFPDNGYGDLLENQGLQGVLPLISANSEEILVDYFVGDTAPGMTWSWELNSFRVGDRGYIYLQAEPDLEAGDPVLGIWEPYSNQQAFETCFLAVYLQHLDPIGVAPVIKLSSRVSTDLMIEALWQVLTSKKEQAELLLSFMQFDVKSPDQVNHEMVVEFVKKAVTD